MAPPNSSSFLGQVVLPASGWEMIAKVRLLLISSANGPLDMYSYLLNVLLALGRVQGSR